MTTVAHEGWLKKRTGNDWKRRFMALEDGRMVTYASESKKMSMGAVGVGEGTFAVIDRGDDIAFEVVKAGKRTEYAVDTTEGWEGWRAALLAVGCVQGEDRIGGGAGAGDDAGLAGGDAVVGAGEGIAPASVSTSDSATAVSTPAPGEDKAAEYERQRAEAKARVLPASPDTLSELFTAMGASGGAMAMTQWTRCIKATVCQMQSNLSTQFRLFRVMDVDDDGVLSLEEFVAGCTGACPLPPADSAALQDWLGGVLADRALVQAGVEPPKKGTAGGSRASGRMKPLELASTPEEHPCLAGLTVQDRLSALYDVVDVNGDGDVSVSELLTSFRKYASSDSLSASLDAQLKLFAAMDTDGSGGLDREEFMAASEHITDPSFLEWVDAVLIEHDKIVNKDRLAAINKVADERISSFRTSTRDFTGGGNPMMTPVLGASSPSSSSPGGTKVPPSLGDVASKRSMRAVEALGRVSAASPRGRGRGRGAKK